VPGLPLVYRLSSHGSRDILTSNVKSFPFFRNRLVFGKCALTDIFEFSHDSLIRLKVGYVLNPKLEIHLYQAPCKI
jgi:hypothetical protein